MITSEFPPKIGGVGNYVRNLSIELIRKGHKVTVFTRGTWKGLRKKFVEGVKVYELPFLPLYPIHLKIHGYSINKVLKSFESIFDVVHVHHPLSPLIRTSLPVMVTVHTTGVFQGRTIELLDLRSLVHKISIRYMYSHELSTFHNSDVITSVSNQVAKELQECYGIDGNSVTTIGNGVNTGFFTPRRTKKNSPYLLYTGRLWYRKGLVDLVKSARYICGEHPEVSFVLTGKGSLENYLKALVKRMKLDDNFLFAGYVDRKTLLDYYQNATVYVLPSYYEGLPTTILEAMACGIPVVTTNVCGTSSVVMNGKNGFIIPIKNPKALAGAVTKLIENEDLRVEMGQFARETVEKNYSWDKTASKVLNCYEQVTKQRA